MCLDKQCSAVPGPSVYRCQLPEPANMLLAQKTRGCPVIPGAPLVIRVPPPALQGGKLKSEELPTIDILESKHYWVGFQRTRALLCCLLPLWKESHVVVFSKTPSGSAEELEPGHLFSFLYKVPHGHDELEQSLLPLSFSVTKARPPTPFSGQLTMTSSFQMATFQPPIVRMMSL